MPATELNFEVIKEAVRLGKINGYITLPAFDYSGFVWQGASHVIAQFNYSASKNFVLKNRLATPAGVNYCLCIKYRVGQQVFRYKLWSGVGEKLQVNNYNDEVIKKNFVLEIWNIETVNQVSNAAAFNIPLSIKSLPLDNRSIVDYKDADSTLVSPSEMVDTLPEDLVTAPLTWTGDVAWLDNP